MAMTKKGKWLGGYVRAGKNGPTYVIERWINGVHWHVSTRCRTERAAIKELERFEQSPRDYRRARANHAAGVMVSPELIDEYVQHLAERKLSRTYVAQSETYLEAVMEALDGADLAHLSFISLRDAIDGIGDPKKKAARMARRKAIKAFCKWLRKEKGLLTRQNDPSLDLTIEAAPPEKHRRRKAMDFAFVERAIGLMAPEVGDIAIVLAATGMHVSELERLHAGEGGLYDPVDWQKPDGVVLNVSVKHKNRTNDGEHKTHVVAITDPAVADALRRILARPQLPSRKAIWEEGMRITKITGTKFSMGWMRHSVATWLALERVPDQDIANQLGHSSTRQARSTYIDLGLSARPVPLPRLKLVKG